MTAENRRYSILNTQRKKLSRKKSTGKKRHNQKLTKTSSSLQNAETNRSKSKIGSGEKWRPVAKKISLYL